MKRPSCWTNTTDEALLGSPGGATILTTGFGLSSLLDHRMTLAQAVLAPRVHTHLTDEYYVRRDYRPK